MEIYFKYCCMRLKLRNKNKCGHLCYTTKSWSTDVHFFFIWFESMEPQNPNIVESVAIRRHLQSNPPMENRVATANLCPLLFCMKGAVASYRGSAVCRWCLHTCVSIAPGANCGLRVTVAVYSIAKDSN